MTDPLAPLITALHGQGRLRVWSLIITVFGDMVQYRGGEISTARLGMLLGRVGVELGALRTALSRLGQDGWVTSTRIGRNSLYRLSGAGIDAFGPATNRIYAAPRDPVFGPWAVSVRLGQGGTPVVTLAPASAEDTPADLRVIGEINTMSPEWRASLLSASHRAALTTLAADLAVLRRTTFDSPLDAAAARLLLIHRWRRIVLRYDEPLPELLPADAPLSDARAAVAGVYRTLTPQTEAWLDAEIGDQGGMQEASIEFKTRFGGLKET